MHPILAVGIAGLSFSFFPLMNAIGMQYAGPFTFALINQIAQVVCSVIILMFLQAPVHMKDALIAFRTLPVNVQLIAFFSGVSAYLGILFFLFALQLMSKAGATLIAEMWPALAIFTAPLMIRKNWERVSLFDVWMLLICFLGVMFITASETGQDFAGFIAHPFFLQGTYEFEEYVGIILAVLSAYCFAFSGVSRAHFANSLPQEFRSRYMGGEITVREAVYTNIVTHILGLPFMFLLLFMMESDAHIGTGALLPGLMNGLFLTLTAVFYSYALLKSDSANINVLWYFAPLLAAVWLIVFGFSVATDMIIIGGAMIVIANVALILVADRKKRRTIIAENAIAAHHDASEDAGENTAEK